MGLNCVDMFVGKYDMDLRSKSSELISEAERQLYRLVKEAQKTEDKIHLKKREDKPYIGSALSHISIETSILQKFFSIPVSKNIPQLVRCHLNKKPNNLLDVVRFCGGIEKAIVRVKYVVDSAGSSIEGYEKDYLKDVLHVLNFSFDVCDVKRVGRLKNDIPFCCLCWREVSYSSGRYCSEHGANRSLIKRDMKRIKRAILELDPDLSVYMNKKKLSVNLMSLYSSRISTAPTKINSRVDFKYFKYSWPYNWRDLAKEILIFSSFEYKQAFFYLKDIDPINFSNWLDWLLEIRKKLDEENSYKDRFREWLKFNDEFEDCLVLLLVICRFDSYLVLNESNANKPGPKKGEVRRNESLRKRILDLFHYQQKNYGKVNRAQIAREVGVTRQRVSVIIQQEMLECQHS